MGREENFSNGKGVGLRRVKKYSANLEYVKIYTNTPDGEDVTSREVLKGTRRRLYEQNFLWLRSAAIPSHNKGGLQGLQVDTLYSHRAKPFAEPGLLRQLICFATETTGKPGISLMSQTLPPRHPVPLRAALW